MRSCSRIPVLALSAALALGVTATVTGEPSAGAAAGPRSIGWRPCAEAPQEYPAVQCGTLSVPVDWARPGGPRFDLDLVRRPATDPAARIGSLLASPGGPAPARDFVIRAAAATSEEIQRRFDIVAVDPRGTGPSAPVLCSTGLVRQQPSYLLTSQADFDRLVAFNRRLRQDCRAHTGPLYDHLDMLSTVRDMDAVRAALGDPRLTWFGLSYGTLNAQQYAEQFPDRIRAILADSVLDHSIRTAAEWLDKQAATAQDSFDYFAGWNARTPSSALYGRDVRALWADLRARAARGELPNWVNPSNALRPQDLIDFAFATFHRPDSALLAQVLADLDAGRPPNVPAPPPRPQPADLVSYPRDAIVCSDLSLPVRTYAEYARHLRRIAGIAPDMRYSPTGLQVVTGCIGLPTPIPNPQHRLRVRGAATPLLLMNSRHDPATGYNLATNVARQLGREGVLLTYDGAGHGVFEHSACTRGAMDRYLIELKLPAPGTHCPDAGPPDTGAPAAAGQPASGDPYQPASRTR